MLRRAVLFFGHAPGLWLVYSEPLPRALWWPNALAVTLTLLAMAAAYPLFGSAHAVLIAWLVGHVLWGSYLAARI